MTSEQIKNLVENEKISLVGLAKISNRSIYTLRAAAHRAVKGQVYSGEINYNALETILKDVEIPSNIEEFKTKRTTKEKVTFDCGDVISFKKTNEVGEIIFVTKKGYAVIECEKEDRMILLSRVGVYCNHYEN